MYMMEKRWPFCDKIFRGTEASIYELMNDLEMHIVEHHHITKKQYQEIEDALNTKQSLYQICNDLIDLNTNFIKKIRNIQEHKSLSEIIEDIDLNDGK